MTTQIMSVSVAAADAVVEADLLEGEAEFATGKLNRLITGISLTGSAAAGDSKVNILSGGTIKAKLYNTATGFCTGATSIIPCSIYIPAGSTVQAVVTNAATTNPLNLVIISQ